MTDKELLEAAARSAGISVDWRGECLCYSASPYNVAWNPLTDDGDALRLAVKLRLNLVTKTLPHAVYVHAYDGIAASCMEPLADVRRAVDSSESATRRAIVRAAAEIYFNKGN